jgi:F-type H+-transporting ATPase subunit b
MTRLPRFVPISFVVLLVLLLGAARAKQQPAAHPTTPEKAAPGHAAPVQETKQASEHAENQGDENAEFKESASVRWLARITGLETKQAYWLAILINFAVVAGAVIWFAKSSLPGMFRARTESIRKTMDDAQRTSADAARRLSEIEIRLSRLDSELAQMRASAEAEAAAEEQRIRAAAAEEACKMEAAVGQEIVAATRLAQRELKAYAAELAVSLAEKRIQVDASTDRVLVQNFVGQLGKNGKEGK